MKKRFTAALFAVLAMVTFVPVASADDGNAHLTSIVTSKHDGFERIELMMDRLPTQSLVQEVDEVWHCAKDVLIPVGGQKFIRTTHFSAAMSDNFKPTYTGPRLFAPEGLTNVKGVALCDFESMLYVSVGFDDVSSTYEVQALTNPTRVVIDIRD
ncbi:hypothetical protein [Lentzea sp. NPDC059081]|uniref:AMIN-like domain-containing (lipo)protein n=1 Tax=Lentzea sp. NPDC059081 TaxID=3346719 RepID=UPI0036BCEEEE